MRKESVDNGTSEGGKRDEKYERKSDLQRSIMSSLLFVIERIFSFKVMNDWQNLLRSKSEFHFSLTHTILSPFTTLHVFSPPF